MSSLNLSKMILSLPISPSFPDMIISTFSLSVTALKRESYKSWSVIELSFDIENNFLGFHYHQYFIYSFIIVFSYLF